MDGDAQLQAAGWRLRAEPGGYEALIGPLYARRSDAGLWVHGFMPGARHANQRGVVHGGMLMSFADHVLGSAVWHGAGKRACATISLDSEFTGAARIGEWIEGRAEVIRQGKSLVFVQGSLQAGERLILNVSGVWKILGEG